MLSIIVPARNNAESTANCLGSIAYSVSRLKLACEFILIDDASAPEERILEVFRNHRAQSPGHETKIIRSRTHQHYSGVFSIGLAHATRDIIFFISNDMLVTTSFIQGLLLVSSLSPSFGIVRGTSNYVDSHPEHVIEPQEPLKGYPDIDAYSRRVLSVTGCTFVEDQVLSGDAILIKRAVVDKIGVLDLRFFGYFGDVDYGMRAHLAGFKLVCAKGAWLFHEGSGHVRHEIVKHGITYDEARDRRMALVETAYREFRRKWQLEGPETFDGGGSVDAIYFFQHARTQAGRVDLKYDLPPSALSDLEFH